MPFWNRSDDPWDRRPERPAPERVKIENPLDTVRQWNGRRKAAAGEKAAAEAALPPERCPWCGEPAERGYLAGGKGVFWNSGRPSAASAWLGPGAFGGSLRVDSEGGLLASWRTAWHCRACRKMFFALEETPSRPEASAEEDKERGDGENGGE